MEKEALLNQLKTISRSSAEFDAYLRGTFSRTHRARFVQTLNPNTTAEQITFEIVPVKDIQRPQGISFLGPLLRIRQLVLILFPFLFVGLNLDGPVYDLTVMLLGLGSLIFLFWAIYLRNDYSDHIKGLDRIYDRAGSQAIQKGWVTAESVKIWSWIYLGAALVLGLPLLWVLPQLLAVVFITGFLIYVSHFRANSFFKTQVWGGWLQGLLIGPLFFVGLELLMKKNFSIAGIVAGCVWGILVLFIIFLHDYETLVPSSQAGLHTWMSFLGFDHGRAFLQYWWIFFLIVFFTFQALHRHWLLWIASLLILAYFSMRFLKNLRSLSTPAGSQVVKLRQEGYLLFILTVTLWSLEEIFYFLFKSVFLLWSRSV